MAGNFMEVLLAEEDDDFLLLNCLNRSENFCPKSALNFQELTNEQCRSMFRFDKDDIEPLRQGLGIPDKLVCSNGTVAGGREGFCILLRRLAYPNRLDDLVPLFGRSKCELSLVSSHVLDLIYDDHVPKLTDLNQSWLGEENLRQFAAAVREKGAPLENCWGFIDGTVRPICRQTRNQRYLFSGHKRVHGIKFQIASTPNGLIAHMFGPTEGRRHDAAMLRLSGLMDQLRNHVTLTDGTILTLYGDPAYPLSAFLMPPFRGAALSPVETLFNKRMSSVRISVEWTFGKVISLFAFLDYKKNQKLYLQPVGKYFPVAALLTNCHTCLYGSETGSFFGMRPPSLAEYLRG